MINYKVVYSKRRSLSICVSENNEVIVRCPKGVSRELIESFLLEKRGWIEKIIAENNQNVEENGDILAFEKVFVNGKKLPLELGEKNLFTDGKVYLKDIKYIKAEFIKNFWADFLAETEEISKATNLKPLSVGVKNYKSRWGCCDARGNIIFNFKALMLPKSIRQYIIVHELCHLKFHNHSASFWRLVEYIMPDWKMRRKELRKFDFLTTLY